VKVFFSFKLQDKNCILGLNYFALPRKNVQLGLLDAWIKSSTLVMF